MSSVSSPKSATAAAAPKPETFEFEGTKFSVRNGKVEDPRYLTSLRSADPKVANAQKAFDAKKKADADANVPMWKKPFVFVSSMISTVWNAFLNLFTWCFPKSEGADKKAAETKSKQA